MAHEAQPGDDRVKAKYRSRSSAEHYRGRFAGGKGSKNTTQLWWKLRQVLGGGPRTILDVPCGTGRFLPLFARQGHATVGVDQSPEMLAWARQLGIVPANPLVRADIRSLPFPDRSFDVTVCIRLFQMLTRGQRIEILRELGRVARESVVVVYDPHETLKQLFRWLRWRLGLIGEPRTRYLSWREIRREIEEAGLSVKARRPVFRWLVDDWIVVCTPR